MRLAVGTVVIFAAVTSVQAQDLMRAGGDSNSGAAPLDQTPQHLMRVFGHPTNRPEESSGHLLDLGPDTLTLLVNGHRLELPIERVRRIQIPGDTVKHGARIGGAVAGLLCASVCSHGLDGASHRPAAVAVTAGLGAAICVGIDAAIPGWTTIYHQPELSSSVVGAQPPFWRSVSD